MCTVEGSVWTALESKMDNEAEAVWTPGEAFYSV
jgi:hypothetical protein